MGDEHSVVVLRRPWWAVPMFLGGWGWAAIVLLAYFSWGAVFNARRGEYLAVVATVVAGLVLSIPLLISLCCQVRVEHDAVVARVSILFVGFRFQSVALVDIAEAVEGVVIWGRGAEVRGVQLVLHNGDVRRLALSFMLGARRRQEWIDLINERLPS